VPPELDDPSAHSEQPDAPAALYVPAAQVEQDDAPAALYVPAAQFVHEVAPAALYVPAGQAVHVEPLRYEPDGHLISILRIFLFPGSAIYKFLEVSIVIPLGYVNCAAVLTPS
jgi:hypothetical protein